MLGYLYGKMFGLKIASANQNESDRVGEGPSRERGSGGQRPTWRPWVCMWRRYGACRGEEGEPRDGRDQTIVFQVAVSFPYGCVGGVSSQTFSSINTPTFSTPVILHTYLPMKMEQIECSEMLAHKIQMGITQKKAYSIKNMAKVWNQE